MMKGKRRISWQAIFTHSSGTTPFMDATKDASVPASSDGSRRRASTSISVARQSTDSSLSTATTATTTTTSPSNVAKALPSRSSPPPAYLLDDDPFANLTPMTVSTRHRANSSMGSTSSYIPRSQRPPPIHPELVPRLSLPAVPVGQAPKSRLQESLDTGAHESDKVRRTRSQDGAKGMEEEGKRKRANTFLVTMSAPVSPSKPLFAPKVPVPPLPTNFESISLPASPNIPFESSGVPPPVSRTFARMQPRPAHQRPAFAARPSLPSLDTLAKTNVVLTNKVRKGRVGAGLPFEPWDNLPEDDQLLCVSPDRPVTPSVFPKTPMKCEDVCAISDLDRTPTSTPVSASPSRSSSSSARSSAISTMSLLATPPPQPLSLTQTVALGPLVEDVELDTTRPLLWSPPLLAASTFAIDSMISPSISSSPNLSSNFVFAAPVALLPSVPEASVLKSLDAANDVFGHSTDDRNSMEITDDENGYFTGDLLDSYGISYTPEPVPEFHEFQRRWANELDNRPDDEAQANRLRWSVNTDHSNADSQPHSPIHSYAGSISDVSYASSYPPSYSFGYGWPSPDRDSMTNVHRTFSLSRSISSTSISASSIGDDTESNMNSSHIRSRSAHTSDSSQGTDVSQSVYDHRLSSRSSTLFASSDSGKNSILHSPDSEWTFFAQHRTHPSHISDILVGPALQKRDSAADHQSQQVQTQVDGGLDSKMPIISLQHCGQGAPKDAQGTSRSQQNSHAVAHDKSQATADDPLPTSSSDSAAPPTPDFLQHTQEARTSFREYSPHFLATPSDQRSSLGAPAAPQPILAETVGPQTLSSTLDSSELLHFETEPVDLHEMNGIDKRLREKMAYSAQRDHHVVGPTMPSNYVSTSPRRDSKSSEEEEQRRRMMLLQMRAYTFHSSLQAREDDKYRSRNATDVVSTSSAASPSSQKRSAFWSSPPSASVSTSDDERDSASSDDDIPLAQRIPSALTAQQSIRRQVHEERQARKAERDKRHRERQATLRPAGAGLGGADPTSKALSTSSGAIHLAASSVSNPTIGSTLGVPIPLRQRSESVHQPQKSQATHPALHVDIRQAFKPEDLARKLQNVKIMSENSQSLAASNMQFQLPKVPVDKLSRSVSGNFRPTLDYPQHATISAPPAPRLKAKRSFHVPEEERPSRDVVPSQGYLPLHKRSMSVGRGDRERSSRRGHEDSVPPLPNPNLNERASLEDRDRGRRVLVKSHTDSKATSPYDLERLQDTAIGGVEGVVTSRHRIFVHSLQHPHVVDIRMDTSAGDLISSLEREGVLDGWAGVGGWMLWEVAQDFGMERPVRAYELISDVQASWLKEKTANYFLLKKSSLSLRLDASAIPSSAPGHSGWVDWEAKRGKWSKRWLRLKENSLYISKKDGRDETLLCSLSNFDAYYVTRSHRAPKSFAFTIKSTDNLSFFENTADYMHTFSCSEKNGEAWVEKILVARSYVLRQERSVLFQRSLNNAPNAPNAGAAISRSGTKKTTVAKPHQPLVDLSPGDIFAPGSLLSKQQS